MMEMPKPEEMTGVLLLRAQWTGRVELTLADRSRVGLAKAKGFSAPLHALRFHPWYRHLRHDDVRINPIFFKDALLYTIAHGRRSAPRDATGVEIRSQIDAKITKLGA